MVYGVPIPYSMESVTGRFAGDFVDESLNTYVTNGAFAGDSVVEETTRAEPIAVVPEQIQVSQKPTNSPLETINFFAGEELAEIPIQKRKKLDSPDINVAKETNIPQEIPQNGEINPITGTIPVLASSEVIEVVKTAQNAPNREGLGEGHEQKSTPRKPQKAGVAKRKKHINHHGAASAEIIAETKEVQKVRTAFSDPEGYIKPFPQDVGNVDLQRTLPANMALKSDRKNGIKSKLALLFEKLGKVSLGIFVGLVIGSLLGGWAIAVFGPWRLTSEGVVTRDIGAPINNIPAGTKITMTQVGTIAPQGYLEIIPVTIGAAKATVNSPIVNENGMVTGYTVTCDGGSCVQGLQFDIPTEAIIGAG